MKKLAYILFLILLIILSFVSFDSDKGLPPAEYQKFRTQAIKNLKIKPGYGMDDLKNESEINKEIDRLTNQQNMR